MTIAAMETCLILAMEIPPGGLVSHNEKRK